MAIQEPLCPDPLRRRARSRLGSGSGELGAGRWAEECEWQGQRGSGVLKWWGDGESTSVLLWAPSHGTLWQSSIPRHAHLPEAFPDANPSTPLGPAAAPLGQNAGNDLQPPEGWAREARAPGEPCLRGVCSVKSVTSVYDRLPPCKQEQCGHTRED